MTIAIVPSSGAVIRSGAQVYAVTFVLGHGTSTIASDRRYPFNQQSACELGAEGAPGEQVGKTALKCAAMSALSCLNPHLSVDAEVNGLCGILSEDIQHIRQYGNVRVVDPVLVKADEAYELPSMYATAYQADAP